MIENEIAIRLLEVIKKEVGLKIEEEALNLAINKLKEPKLEQGIIYCPYCGAKMESGKWGQK